MMVYNSLPSNKSYLRCILIISDSDRSYNGKGICLLSNRINESTVNTNITCANMSGFPTGQRI